MFYCSLENFILVNYKKFGVLNFHLLLCVDTYTSLCVVYLLSCRASGAIHLIGSFR